MHVCHRSPLKILRNALTCLPSGPRTHGHAHRLYSRMRNSKIQYQSCQAIERTYKCEKGTRSWPQKHRYNATVKQSCWILTRLAEGASIVSKACIPSASSQRMTRIMSSARKSIQFTLPSDILILDSAVSRSRIVVTQAYKEHFFCCWPTANLAMNAG